MVQHMKNWLLIITFLVMFEGNSIHSRDYSSGKKQNSNHDLIGIEYHKNRSSLSFATFINSHYNHSTLLKIKYQIHKNINLAIVRLTGYYKDSPSGILYFPYPSLEFDYKNLIFELYALPPTKNKAGVIILTKSVRF